MDTLCASAPLLLGRREKAAKLLEEMKKARIGFITIRTISFWHPFADRVDAERFADGLRKAGVPD